MFRLVRPVAELRLPGAIPACHNPTMRMPLAIVLLLTACASVEADGHLSLRSPRPLPPCASYDAGCSNSDDCCSGVCLVGSGICIAPGCDPHLCPGQKAICKQDYRGVTVVDCYPP
jgi:hypothetical protein